MDMSLDEQPTAPFSKADVTCEPYTVDRANSRKALALDTPYVDTRSGRFLPGRTRDVSVNGVFVESPEHPPVGTVVDLFIGGVGVGKQVLGRVVRSANDGFAAIFTGDTDGVATLLA